MYGGEKAGAMTPLDAYRRLSLHPLLPGRIRGLLGLHHRLAGHTKRFFSTPDGLVRRIQRRPTDVRAWVLLIDLERRRGRLRPEIVDLVRSRGIEPTAHVLNALAYQIGKRAEATLRELAADPTSGLEPAIEEIVRWKTIIHCRYTFITGRYFRVAEKAMQGQWDDLIWPIIKNFDFTSVVDLACGHGRNTEQLRRHAATIHLVDVNKTCIEACRKRFGEEQDGCRFVYHVTAGNDLRMIPENSITLGYSWDSMVHFDKLVVRDYLFEFVRILKRGGRVFLHHSNYGALKPNSDWAFNRGARSDVSSELFRQYAEEAGLRIISQRLFPSSGLDDLDCITVVEWPG
jgi:ubiquinone/menaquinone biosynthesis C-methylase UbiE